MEFSWECVFFIECIGGRWVVWFHSDRKIVQERVTYKNRWEEILGCEKDRHIILWTERERAHQQWKALEFVSSARFFLTAHFSLSFFFLHVRFSSQYSCSDNLSGVAEAQKSINVMHHFCSLKRTAFHKWLCGVKVKGVVQRGGDAHKLGLGSVNLSNSFCSI